jgi:acyl-CoA reductase-like NAD-dependent aldehyde dehydrogenase
MAASAGLIALPAWAEGWNLDSLPARLAVFNSAEQDMLASVADTIIPAGDSIGALSVGVDKFLTALFDRCYEKDVQDNLKKQLSALDADAQSTHGKSFAACDLEQRTALLLKFSDSAEEDKRKFFELVKSETIRGFSTSKEVMVGYHNYKVAPGHYYGCVDVNS